MRIESVPIENKNPLVKKYLYEFSEVAHLFEYNPHEVSSFFARQETVREDYRTDRSRLVRILTEYNLRLHCGAKTLENLEKLAQSDTLVVISGQQAGVLTGPMYTIHKTISVIQLADKISAETGIKTVPVFWIASEDHDYAEVDHIDFIDRQQKPARLKLDYSPQGKFSVGRIPVTEAVFALINQLAADTNPSEWKNQIIARVKEAAQEADSLADWFALLMAWLFRDYGLIMVDPLNPELRKLWSGTYDAFLENNVLINEKLQAGMERVRALGFVPQVEKTEETVNMFLYVEGERLALLKKGETYTARGRNEFWSLAQLQAMARQKPELFSPNVVLRPVAQDVLLPILAYVAGPGEISYYSLYREIYLLLSQRMPIIYPRVNITLMERAVAKNMDRFGISFAEGLGGLQEKLRHCLDSEDQIGIDKVFVEYGSGIEKLFLQLVDQVSGIDADLPVQGREALHKIMHQIDYFQKKTSQYHRRSCELLIKRFETVENNLFPAGNLQERVLNVFPYLFRYGPGLIDGLMDLPLLSDRSHKLVYLGQ